LRYQFLKNKYYSFFIHLTFLKTKIMKTRIFAIALLAFISHVCLAQDVITYKNGTEAIGKVTEITGTEIKFKKLDNPDGPVYSVSKAEIFMIKYANGNREVFGDSAIPVEVEKEDKKGRKESDDRIKYTGPRIGFTVIGEGTTRDYIVDDLGRKPVITQFGWQLETRVFTLENGTSGLFEWVGLIGGVEQGMFLPSVTGLFGIRSKNGFEFGLGPNVSVAGFSMAFALGTSFRSGNVYFPVNLAIVTSVPKKVYTYGPDGNEIETIDHTGIRVGMTIGFNTRKN